VTRLPWILAILVGSSLSVVACSQCGSEVVAQVVGASGDVQRDRQASPGQFARASVTDSLYLGDGLRTGARSSAELRLVPDGSARIEERTLVRFMSERPADGVERLTIVEGVIEIDAHSIDLELDTGHGVARVKGGGRIRARAAQPNDVQLDILVGRVQIERPGLTPQPGAAGETIVLVAPRPPDTTRPIEEATPQAEPESPQAGPEPSIPEEPTGEGNLEIVKSIDFRLGQLESAVVHAASVPVDIALPLDPCPEPHVIEMNAGKRRSARTQSSDRSVSVRLKAGAQRLTIRCGGQKKELTLRIVRDAATLELPKTAPGVDVSADGRRYTVRYQNLLPSVRLSWPAAEPSGRYILHVKRGQAREQRFEGDKPEKQLRSGELAEGDYSFWFETREGKRSRESGLRISFDNTARSAYLSEPIENGQAAAQQRVAGAALVRSQVSVAGVNLKLDSQGRFEGLIPHSADENAIAVRVSHPSTGVHYYLRRTR